MRAIGSRSTPHPPKKPISTGRSSSPTFPGNRPRLASPAAPASHAVHQPPSHGTKASHGIPIPRVARYLESISTQVRPTRRFGPVDRPHGEWIPDRGRSSRVMIGNDAWASVLVEEDALARGPLGSHDHGLTQGVICSAIEGL